jgi:hypothetical protein
MFFIPFLGTANVVRIFLINKVINKLLLKRIYSHIMIIFAA